MTLGACHSTVGILAYGSLIDDPGDEINAVIVERLSPVDTPFRVEFARKSQTRGDAPTLVPVSEAGAYVRACLLVLDTSSENAMDMLWRRETRTNDRTRHYSNPPAGHANRVKVEQLHGFSGIDLVFYTSIAANIQPLTAAHVADLAIASVARAPLGEDGISYLMAAKANQIETTLSGPYEREILSRTGAGTLEDALASLK
ncbi:hypothetical protein [Sphingomonas sp. URHD0057]|uniref:hypothetical protein n=1 Tax=Sphingomonas sp. URHD0057 TaxID=1380389 RepID=UPI00048D95DC|nr:hypothetical protein [Sphingomonas sp. URHD0057]